MLSYDVGLDEPRTWQTDTFKWMLIASGKFVRTHATITAVLGVCTEVGVSGYARKTVTTPVRVLSSGRYEYHCDNPNFGALGAGATPIAFLLYKDNGGGDATNIPIGWYPKQSGQATNVLNPYTATLTSGIALRIQAIPFQ